ncbi:hypothetical protein QQS21_002212 [Conoideocrella luteorostrata]|uniref:Actin-like ATPase domain-containing protein n=1 Tax=Conoideocrella luteorostrata TaxID=1105319 RepID=A0AAJ0CVL8_9HYPO|nr:hypothetical protein QQS21_002212 [Conoideocrella luteorostrata]
MDWPGTNGVSAPKTPTIVRYKKLESAFEWGAVAERAEDAIIGIKLLLDPSQKRPEYLSVYSSQKIRSSLPKPAVNIASDLIGKFYERAISEISKTVPQDYFDLCSKEYVLTVPAVWSDAAKHATMTAAKLAGIYPVTLIKEPEAAALYAARSIGFALKANDAFVVCDAGGGTVDLISYEIESTVPTLRVKELVPGTGGMSGSIGLNARFAAEVQEIVGEEQWRALQETRGWTRALKQFDEEIKRAFNGDENQSFWLDFPMAHLQDNETRRLRNDAWEMTGRDLTRIFEPLIKDIINLIQEQVEQSRNKRHGKDVDGILLVGGFGSSQYLRQMVRKHFPSIEAIQPNDAWAAVVKGAVVSKIPQQAIVASISAPRHYGVEAWCKYDHEIDMGRPSNEDRSGRVEVQRMTWYIKKGDTLRRDQKIKFPFYRQVDRNFDSSELHFDSELYQCDDLTAPDHRAKSTKVKLNCTVTCDLSRVAKCHFRKRRDLHDQL